VKNPGLSCFSSKQLSALDPNASSRTARRDSRGAYGSLMKCGFQQYFAWIGAESRTYSRDGEFSRHPGILFAHEPERRDDIRKGFSPPPKDMGPSVMAWVK